MIHRQSGLRAAALSFLLREDLLGLSGAHATELEVQDKNQEDECTQERRVDFTKSRRMQRQLGSRAISREASPNLEIAQGGHCQYQFCCSSPYSGLERQGCQESELDEGSNPICIHRHL